MRCDTDAKPLCLPDVLRGNPSSLLMIMDVWFYAAALPAVTLFGLSKGGLAGVGLLGMPLMSLVMSPIEAAAIMLPVLIVQDVYSVSAFRKTFDVKTLVHLLPGALAGILGASLVAAWITPQEIKIGVGLLAIGFCVYVWVGNRLLVRRHSSHSFVSGSVLGALSGFSSFVIHAGGPPFNVYAVQRGLSRDDFVGTSAVFFASLNLLKLPPYFALGQFTWQGFLASATLFPVALAANALGVYIVRRMSTALFYKLVYGATFIIGVKLVADGLMTGS